MAAEHGYAIVTCRAGEALCGESGEHEGGRAADGTFARRGIRSQLRLPRVCLGMLGQVSQLGVVEERLVDGGEEEVVNGFSRAALQTVNDQGDDDEDVAETVEDTVFEVSIEGLLQASLDLVISPTGVVD